jgi:hypothetical protein
MRNIKHSTIYILRDQSFSGTPAQKLFFAPPPMLPDEDESAFPPMNFRWCQDQGPDGLWTHHRVLEPVNGVFCDDDSRRAQMRRWRHAELVGSAMREFDQSQDAVVRMQYVHLPPPAPVDPLAVPPELAPLFAYSTPMQKPTPKRNGRRDFPPQGRGRMNQLRRK